MPSRSERAEQSGFQAQPRKHLNQLYYNSRISRTRRASHASRARYIRRRGHTHARAERRRGAEDIRSARARSNNEPFFARRCAHAFYRDSVFPFLFVIFVSGAPVGRRAGSLGWFFFSGGPIEFSLRQK